MSNWIERFIAKTSRDTSSGGFIPVLDGLRFAAIFSVIFCHLVGFIARKEPDGGSMIPLVRFFLHGAVGVKLFFVISGFIIALPFARAHLGAGPLPRLGSYYSRRLTRLEPPYFVNLLLSFLVVPFILHVPAAQLLPNLAASAGYLHGIIFGQMSALNFVAWSLEVELQFYLLAPIVARLFKIPSRPRRRALLLLLIACFSTLSCLVDDSPRFTLSILASAQFFLTGFLLVDVYLCDWQQAPRPARAWDLLSLCSWVAIGALPYLGKSGEALLPVPIFLAYCSAFKGELSSWFFSRPPVYLVGGMCYSAYLYHFLVIFASVRVIERIGLAAAAPLWLSIVVDSMLVIPAVLLVTFVLFVLIEKPCMKRDWHLALAERMKAACGVRSPRASLADSNDL